MPRHIHPKPFVIQPPADLVHTHPELRLAASQLASLYADGKLVTDEHLQLIGSALWQTLNVSLADFDAARGDAGAAILPVIIESSAAAVQALPWETLFHPTLGFIGKNPAFTLTRQLAARTAPALPLAKGPLRVLLFTSLPNDVDAEKSRLKVEEEQAQVLEALLPWLAKGVVELEMPDDGRFSTLQAMLKSFQPHVLFLSGHGKFHHAPHSGEAPYGAFFFEDEIGDSQAVKEDEIARALIGSGVQAVILSACESSKTAPTSEALNNGLAQRISGQGIPYVIGMRESVYDEAGIQFARALCDELAGGERIDFALQAARIAIQTHFKPGARREGGAGIAEELSHGQWCLPMLISSNLHNALIDWNFEPKAVDAARLTKNTLGEVLLPARFIGRRTELRDYKNRLFKGELHHLLITAPGGQGKTSLAGKLALDMQQRGWQVFAWSARTENPWQEYVFEEMQLALDKEGSEKYDKYLAQIADEGKRAKKLLNLLLQQFNHRVILFLDNLESIQHPDTQALSDSAVAAWIAAARATPGVILLATSRWLIPGWNGEHCTLERANYGDFLQMARRLSLPRSLFEKRELRHVHEVLGGNCRGLEFFAAALKQMAHADEESAFLDKLVSVEAELQANMAIEEIVSHLPANALQFLQRLPAYAEPVPLEGIIKLGLDLPEPEVLLQRLLAVSLLEAGYEPHWQVVQYQCSPLVADWFRQQGQVDDAAVHLNAAADFHLYLFRHERNTLNQAIAVHNALRRATRNTEADRLTLDAIVGTMRMAGWYTSLLNEWLPRICDSQDLQNRAEALGYTGELNVELGNYETALGYLKQSLNIRQQIGDKAGEGATLCNIGVMFHAQGDYETALDFMEQSLSIRQRIGNKKGEATALHNISQIYEARGDFETALGYLKQSLSIRQQIGDKAGEGITLGNIGAIYHAQGDYETALRYMKQSLSIGRDKAGNGVTLGNIGAIYHAQGDNETALLYMKQSLNIRQQIGDKAGEGAILCNIGAIYFSQGDFEMALSYLKQSLVIQQQIGNKPGLCVTLFNMGNMHAKNEQMQEAFSAWVNVYIIARQINEAQILQALSQLAPQLGMAAGLDGWEQLAQSTKHSPVANKVPTRNALMRFFAAFLRFFRKVKA